MAKHAKSASERLSNPRNVQFKRDLSHLEKLILRSTQKFWWWCNYICRPAAASESHLCSVNLLQLFWNQMWCLCLNTPKMKDAAQNERDTRRPPLWRSFAPLIAAISFASYPQSTINIQASASEHWDRNFLRLFYIFPHYLSLFKWRCVRIWLYTYENGAISLDTAQKYGLSAFHLLYCLPAHYLIQSNHIEKKLIVLIYVWLHFWFNFLPIEFN